jgi:WD repeat-containing protein 55
MVFDTVCTLPLPADLFAQIVHPTQPLIIVGLSSGHVHTFKLPPASDSEDEGGESTDNESVQKSKGTNGTVPIISSCRRSSIASENGLGSIETAWKTKRHKGSCRVLAFSHDGNIVYSAGTDGIVKAAYTETGRVVSKIAIPLDGDGDIDAPTVLHALSPQSLLLGTDSGKLYVHDLRAEAREVVARASKVFEPHDGDFVSSITPLPVSETSTSGFPKTWISTGGMTVAATDLRKGVVKRSEDQGEELTASLFVGGLKKGGTSVGEKVVVGQGSGVVSLWEKGVWDDLDERVVVDRGGSSIESLVEVPLGVGGVGRLEMNEKAVAVGLEDGRIRFMRLGPNKVVHELDARHHDVDGVMALGFDVAGRMISGGGQIVKVWHEAKGLPGGMRNIPSNGLRSDDSDEEVEDSSDEEISEKRKRKKRKRNKGKDKSGGRPLNFSGFG